MTESEYRRDFLAALSTVATIGLTGCSDNRGVERTDRNSQSASFQSATPEQIRIAEEKIGNLYQQLDAHPIAIDDEFVFDVRGFENEFDRRKALNRANTAQKLINETRPHTRDSRQYLSNLLRTARVGELQMKQRVLLYRTIQTALMYRQLFREPDFLTATKVIKQAKTYLSELTEMGTRIDATLEPTEGNEVQEYDFERFQREQEVLLEVSIWLVPSYEGFHHLAKGMDRIYSANRELEAENFEMASKRYGEANTYFKHSMGAFNEAHGKGRPVWQFKRFVRESRCMLPVYLRFTEEISTVFTRYGNGEKKEARAVARDLLYRFRIQTEGCT